MWHHDEQVAAFRDAAVRIHTTGLLGRPADLTLPAPMRLLLGEAADVPATVTVIGERHDSRVELVLRPGSWARLALPSEVHLDRVVVLAEAMATARVTGSVDGTAIDVTGPGIVELLHG